ncbi:tetratricopeptide repeat protein [Nocardia sp. CA-145437]|uniref:tetratricopeptide repeat protein n=1 Tax=Nocardia sp. CA-145437 TaxID=3239980 RepID=UPI003D9554F9
MSEKIKKARVLADLGRFDAAREMLGEVLAGDPEDPEALADMANLAYREGEYERALEFAGAAFAGGAGRAVRVAGAGAGGIAVESGRGRGRGGAPRRPYRERKAVARVPVPRPKSDGSRFGRWAAVVGVLVIRVVIAALGSDHDSAPTTTDYTPPRYTAPPTFPSYLRQYPLTVPPMPTWLDRPPTYIPPPNFPTYRPPAPR